MEVVEWKNKNELCFSVGPPVPTKSDGEQFMILYTVIIPWRLRVETFNLVICMPFAIKLASESAGKLSRSFPFDSHFHLHITLLVYQIEP